MATATPAVVNITKAYATKVKAVRGSVDKAVLGSWRNLSTYRSDDIKRFARKVTPVVEAGQVQVASLTDAYLAQIEANVRKASVRPVGVPRKVVLDETMRGVPAIDVYQRAGPTVWSSLAAGDTLDYATNKALARMLLTAATDLQLAKTHSSRHIFSQKDSVVGFRRVLSGGKTCALCAVAATQRYHSEDLLPIHPGCSCGVEPIFGDVDPGQVIDPDGLDSVHESIAERFGTGSESAREVPNFDDLDYKDVLVVHEHGEIGPVLAIRGQNFDKGPDR